MPRIRPTLRCLRENLKIAIPAQSQPLDEMDHPLVAKANEQFADLNTPHERIAAVDDQIMFKIKVRRWRGAVWEETDLGWLVAAGWREDGSGDDFYQALTTGATAARRSYNATHRPQLSTATYTAHLLPTGDDRDRYRAEAVGRLVRHIIAVLHQLVRTSLRDGHEHAQRVDTFTIGVQVRADHGHETYVAVWITGSVPRDVIATILNHVPGCDPSQWNYADRMPDRTLRPGESAYLNLMDPVQAAKLLDNY